MATRIQRWVVITLCMIVGPWFNSVSPAATVEEVAASKWGQSFTL